MIVARVNKEEIILMRMMMKRGRDKRKIPPKGLHWISFFLVDSSDPRHPHAVMLGYHDHYNLALRPSVTQQTLHHNYSRWRWHDCKILHENQSLIFDYCKLTIIIHNNDHFGFTIICFCIWFSFIIHPHAMNHHPNHDQNHFHHHLHSHFV